MLDGHFTILMLTSSVVIYYIPSSIELMHLISPFSFFGTTQLNRCHGTMSVYQSNISKNKIDLKQAQYKDIDKRYFDQLIQLKV